MQWSGAGWGQRYSNGFQSFTEVLKEEGQGERGRVVVGGLPGITSQSP